MLTQTTGPLKAALFTGKLASVRTYAFFPAKTHVESLQQLFQAAAFLNLTPVSSGLVTSPPSIAHLFSLDANGIHLIM